MESLAFGRLWASAEASSAVPVQLVTALWSLPLPDRHTHTGDQTKWSLQVILGKDSGESLCGFISWAALTKLHTRGA